MNKKSSKKKRVFFRKREKISEQKSELNVILSVKITFRFVSSYYYYLIEHYSPHQALYHWQYLKTGKVKRNDDNKYSRENSMNFVRGNKSSKIIHHLSSIAWLSLCEFCYRMKSQIIFLYLSSSLQC